MNDSTYNVVTKIWSGPEKPPIYNTNVSLGYLILNVFKNTPDRITQVFADNDTEMTCHEMRVRTIKVATHLIKSGLKQGDVVGIMATNSENLAPVVFACFTLGLPVSSLSQIMIESDIINMYLKTKPKIFFCDANIISTVQSAVDKMEINPEIYTFMDKVVGYKFVDEILEADCNVDEFIFPKLFDVKNLPAIILCSSGTTGQPKGVCKSHSQIISQIYPNWTIKSSNQQVYMNFSTLHWVSGFLFLIYGTLYGGRRVITTKLFSVDLFVELCSRYKITTTLMVPSAMISLLHESPHPIESIESLLVGGATIPIGLNQSAQRLFPNANISAIYGMTEVDLVADSFVFKRDGSVGKVSENSHIKIIDDNETNLGPNQQGEVCIKTQVTFSGYFGEPEKTAEAINKGWVYSGDIGYFDDDGFLFVVSRKKDMLKYNNYQVFPSELEEIINEIDGVFDSCVVGVSDESNGNDLIFGFVVKDPNNDKLTEDFIRDYVNTKVIDAKKLRGGVHFIDTLPMSINGKILKDAVKKIAQQNMKVIRKL